MPPDADPLLRPGAPVSSRNAVRGGVLAALSTPAPAALKAVPEAIAAAPLQSPPARGIMGVLRAVGRRGLRVARPLAMPFLHRFQMRVRTAVDGSEVAGRTAGIERELAVLSGRVAAVQREVASVAGTISGNTRRLDDLAAAAAEGARHSNAARTRLDAIQQGVEAISETIRAGAARRAPIPLGEEVMVWTPEGPLLLPAEDPRLLAAMSEGGVLEHGTRRVLASLLPPGGAFLDVGAHVGTMALLAARRVGGRGRVFAVEPLPRLAALLRRNMALNDVADRVSVAACAAGEAAAEGRLHIGEVLGHSSLLPLSGAEAAGTVQVAVRRMDDVVPAGLPVDAVKIDAEGAELMVWRGMRRVLDESPGIAAVLEFGPSHLARAGIAPGEWLGELEAAGFESYAIDEATGVCRPASASALAGMFSVNVLLLRPGAASRHPDLVFA